MIYPMIALVTLLAGGYRRSGFGKRVIVAVALCALLQVLVFAARAQVQERAEVWPLMYLPVLLGSAYLAIMLLRLSRARRAPAAALPA
jgi:lipopolysaccharide export system permease protein